MGFFFWVRPCLYYSAGRRESRSVKLWGWMVARAPRVRWVSAGLSCLSAPLEAGASFSWCTNLVSHFSIPCSYFHCGVRGKDLFFLFVLRRSVFREEWHIRASRGSECLNFPCCHLKVRTWRIKHTSTFWGNLAREMVQKCPVHHYGWCWSEMGPEVIPEWDGSMMLERDVPSGDTGVRWVLRWCLGIDLIPVGFLCKGGANHLKYHWGYKSQCAMISFIPLLYTNCLIRCTLKVLYDFRRQCYRKTSFERIQIVSSNRLVFTQHRHYVFSSIRPELPLMLQEQHQSTAPPAAGHPLPSLRGYPALELPAPSPGPTAEGGMLFSLKKN